MTQSQRTIAVKAILDSKPGAVAEPFSAPRALSPSALLYKVKGKIFAILSQKNGDYVIVKCDPHQVDLLKAQYAGIGHRSHLDRRFWICIELDADVPPAEVTRLVNQSYDVICASFPRKQQGGLIAPVARQKPKAKAKPKPKTTVKRAARRA
jgi:predicted DNA-binding protein (MmcQ/YjbR family)